LNQQTIRDFFPILRTKDLFLKAQGSKIFSIIDSWSAYHRIRISEPDIAKAVFMTPFGLFEYLVTALK